MIVVWVVHALAVVVGVGAGDGVREIALNLEGATLFVPEGFRAENGRVNLVVHLHGALKTTGQALGVSGWNAALLVFNRQGLSSVYQKPFSDPALFSKLVDSAVDALREQKVVEDPKLGTLILSSFSAGFGGVREILKSPEDYARVDALVLADSLYAGYEGDAPKGPIDPTKIADFARFAKDAAEGRKAMLVSHSAQVPAGYASTTETADELIRRVGGDVQAARKDWGGGWIESRRFTRGKLLVLGFDGTEGADHMRHLRRIGELWKALPADVGLVGVP